MQLLHALTQGPITHVFELAPVANMVFRQRVDTVSGMIMMMTAQGGEEPQRANVILLANQPRMLRELMHQVLRRIPQTHFVFEFANGDELSALLDAVHARWLVVSLAADGNLPKGIEEIMVRHPEMDVLAMSEDGDYLEIITAPEETQRDRIMLADISLNELVAVLSLQ